MMVPDAVYRFDINRRVYEKRGGFGSGGAIYREHWVKFTVIGETKMSWLVKEYPHKLAKKKVMTASEVDDDCWVHGNAHRIIDKIRQCNDASVLRAVADLVGFKESAS